MSRVYRRAANRGLLGLVLAFGCVGALAAQQREGDSNAASAAPAGALETMCDDAMHGSAKERAASRHVVMPVETSVIARDNATASTEHIAPPAPRVAMSAMEPRAMIDAMEMNDDAMLALGKLDRFERVASASSIDAAWKLSAWVGDDFDRLALRSEGERTHDGVERADVELFWSRASAAFWNTEVGMRRDFGRGADRTWAAFGVQGRAPYGFEVGATAYAGSAGRSAIRIEVDYAFSLTQRLILQPRLELNAYGRTDARALTGAGLSDAAFGLRMRYEIRREFAPYVGVEWSNRFGRSADFARADGVGARDTQWVAGLRVWY